MAQSQYDFVIFGATGFTGQYVVEELHHVIHNESKSYTYAVAGRSASKAQGVLERVSARLNDPAVKDIPVVVADVADAASIDAMCKAARCVINCVGPYRFFGEVVVQACVDHGKTYVDITGEPDFMERMAHMHGVRALETGALVVSSCGFDSIPADVGTEHCVAQFPERNLVSYVESFLAMDYTRGVGINYATWESAVHGFANQASLVALRKEVREAKIAQGKGARLPVIGPALRPRHGLHYNKALSRWILPFHGSDASVVRRTQSHLYEATGLWPVQFGAYVALQQWRNAALMVVFGAIFSKLAAYSWGRTLLLNYPAIFSCGLVHKNSTPSEEDIATTTFNTTFIGRGYSAPSLADQTAEPDVRIITRCSGPEPGYVTTPIVVVASAVTLLEERESLEVKAGIVTPGVALRNTGFVDRVAARGVKFELVDRVQGAHLD